MLLPTIVTSKERGMFEVEHMRYKLTNISNAKLLILMYLKMVSHAEINHEYCTDVVKTDLPLVNHCYMKDCKTVTIEWK